MSILTVLIIFAIITYTLFEVFASRAANRIDANLSAAVFNGLGMIIPVISYIAYRVIKKAEIVPSTMSGWIYSILAGIAIAFFSILLIKIFEKGGLSYVIPLIYGGSIGLASLLGILLFKETISALQLGGIAVILSGIGMVIFSKM